MLVLSHEFGSPHLRLHFPREAGLGDEKMEGGERTHGM